MPCRLRAHHHELLVMASSVTARHPYQEGVFDREEVGEVVEEVDVGGFHLGGDGNRRAAVLPALANPEDGGDGAAALHPAHRVEIRGLDVRPAHDDGVEFGDVDGGRKRCAGEEIAVAVGDPRPRHVRGRGAEGIPELGVAVDDAGTHAGLPKLDHHVADGLVDRRDPRPWRTRRRDFGLLVPLPPPLADLHPQEAGVGAQGRDGSGDLAAKRTC